MKKSDFVGKSASSNRGKHAEGVVQTALKALERKHAAFTFNRVYDAHTAGGKFPAQAGDFQWFYKYSYGDTYNGVIEVKEVEHECRLPYKNFTADKVARIRKRELAGSACLVLVCHRIAGRTFWRSPPFDFFRERDALKPGGSWDLSSYLEIDPLDILGALA